MRWVAMESLGKRFLFLTFSIVIMFSVLGSPVKAAYNQGEVITPELKNLFSSYDSDHNHALDWAEAMNFYNWVESAITYRYDDENDTDGKMALAMHQITSAQLGDGRPGKDYWQKPTETYAERYGDCEDMAILELSFYNYYNITSDLALVDIDGDGVIDHAVCIVAFSEQAFQQLVQYQGISEYYDLNSTKFVIIDNAYSDAYGFVGKYDPVTHQPIPYQDIDFTMYETMTLEEIYNAHWQTGPAPTPIPVIAIIGGAIGFAAAGAAIAALVYLNRRKRAREQEPATPLGLEENPGSLANAHGGSKCRMFCDLRFF
jgi:hypothetical protein